MTHYNKGLSYALRLITKKRYTEHQIIQKLNKYFEKQKQKEEEPNNINTEELVSEILNRLKDLNYIDDQQYISDYVEQRMRTRPRGIFMLKRELMRKGIDNKNINIFFQEKQIDELEPAMKCLEKKAKLWEKHAPFDKKRKAIQHLQSRGFNFESISQAISAVYKI